MTVKPNKLVITTAKKKFTIKLPSKFDTAKNKLAKYGFALFNPYQEDGVKWMISRERMIRSDGSKVKGPYGGFICDEMGLGKTIQIISLIMANPVRNTLLVLPSNLISQWNDEFRKFAPELDIFVHHGDNRIYHSSQVTDRDNKPIVWITSYGLLRGIKDQITVFQRIKWDRMILEECHIIRNPKSGVSRSIMNIYAKVKWGITGTPIQNRIRDLYTLFQYFGIDPIFVKNNIEFIRKKYIIRRTKEMVRRYNAKLDLPKLNVQSVKVSFKSQQELDLYTKVNGEVKKGYCLIWISHSYIF